MTIKYSIIIAAVIATGCSSGGDSSGQSNTGVFLDSAVSGIKYKTETKNGETNAAGEFSFLPGENVTFSIGDVDLPATPAGTTITPLDIFNTQSINDTSVVNAARLLQTLDEDGNPENGISITAAAHTSATGLTLDFSSQTFDNDVTNLVANSGSSTTSLIDEATAVSHLQDTLAESGLLTLVGSWYIPSNNKTLITFIDETNYYVTQKIGAGEPLCSHGMESGTYTWNSVTGTFNLTNVIDTTGDCGLTSSQGETYTASLEISGNTLSMTDTEGTLQLSKVVDASKPIVGSWYIVGTNRTLVTFVDNTQYFVAQDVRDIEELESGISRDGMEYGNYTYSIETGDMTFTNIIDTNGDSGLTSVQGEIFNNVTATINDSRLTVSDEEGVFSLYAIK